MNHEELSADVAAFRPMVYRLAFGCTGDRFDADDVTQEVFLRFYGSGKSFADSEHKKAFLIRATVNLCKNLQNSVWKKKRTVLDENTPAEIVGSGSGNESESESVLREYIQNLKPAYRAVIHLFYYEGYSVKETAKILKISETAVTSRLSRARARLKTQLTNEEVFKFGKNLPRGENETFNISLVQKGQG